MAITDHAVGLRFGGLTAEDLTRQRDEIERLRGAYPQIAILHGAELNIGRDGSLDYDDEILSGLDFRLAAVHSFFGLSAAEQTDRVLRAVSHPLVHAIAHPTGRRIGVRPPLHLDMAAVAEAAAECLTALEVNGHLDRLDLSVDHCQTALAQGCLFLADSDAHRPAESANRSNAVGVLQRAGAPRHQVLNTWATDDFARFLKGP